MRYDTPTHLTGNASLVDGQSSSLAIGLQTDLKNHTTKSTLGIRVVELLETEPGTT